MIFTKNRSTLDLDIVLDIWEMWGVSENSVSLNPMVNDHYPY